MPRPARPWFRFYVEAMRDPKMRRLTPAQRWLWVAILAAARESCLPGFLYIAEGVPMSWDDLADYSGVKLSEVEQATRLMADLRMIEFDRNVKTWCVPAWNERQYESDNSTERTRKHRHGNVPTSLEGTAPETETETETENPRGARKRGTRIPDEFVVTAEMQAWVEQRCPRVNWRHHTERFVNYWKAASGRNAVKGDWERTWRNWMLKEQGA